MKTDSPTSVESDEMEYATDSGQRVQDQPQLEDYRQRYGLAVDPFADDPYFPFFTGAQRRELLDQIIHLCQFGSSLPLVLGERGVGKTRVALALYEAMGSNSACFIGALPTLNSEDLFSHIVQQFNLPLPKEATLASLQSVLQTYGRSHSSDELALVLIDNAQDLDDATLLNLLGFVQASGEVASSLRLVLFGDLSLLVRLQALSGTQALISDLYLERFTLAESLDYLNFRMEMADYLGPEMFTEPLIEPWWRESQGQINQLHRHASRHLLETVLPPLSKTTRPFPLLHIVAIAVLGGAVLMTVIYRGETDKPVNEVVRVDSVPIALPRAQPSTLPPAVANPAPNNTASDVKANLANGTDVVGELSRSEQGSAPNEVLERNDNSGGTTSTQNDKAATVREYSLPERDSSVVVASAKPAATAKPAVQAAVAASPKETTAPVKTAPAKLSEDEQTLMSWRATDVTLQLLGVSTEKAARDYMASQQNRANLLMFKTIRQNKDWFVVVAGRYASSTEARAAVANLPASQIKAGPWPRELKVIQSEITR